MFAFSCRDPRSWLSGSSCARAHDSSRNQAVGCGDQDAGETDLRTCPICLQAITRRATVYQSRCQPVPHEVHMHCWRRQTKSQRAQCCVCRQNTVDDLTFIAVAELCGVDRPRATVADLTPCGQGMLENYQLDVVSPRELWSFLLWMRGDGDRPSDDALQRLSRVGGSL